MPNLASILKGELSRVARKEIRTETAALKKAVNGYRSEIASLKRRTQALEQQVRRVSKTRGKVVAAEDEAPASGLRFTAKGLISQRRRLSLSAPDCGLLIGASAQSIYNWEEGKVRPRAEHLPALAALRKLGKKSVAVRLATLKEAA